MNQAKRGLSIFSLLENRFNFSSTVPPFLSSTVVVLQPELSHSPATHCPHSNTMKCFWFLLLLPLPTALHTLLLHSLAGALGEGGESAKQWPFCLNDPLFCYANLEVVKICLQRQAWSSKVWMPCSCSREAKDLLPEKAKRCWVGWKLGRKAGHNFHH